MSAPGIDPLRARIDAVDAALRALIDERLDLARAVGAAKRGAEVRRPVREAEVRAAWEAHGRAARWPDGLATALGEALLAAGRTVQGG